MVLTAASSPSCITFTIHTPVQLWGPTCFALPEQYDQSPHPQQSGKVYKHCGENVALLQAVLCCGGSTDPEHEGQAGFYTLGLAELRAF